MRSGHNDILLLIRYVTFDPLTLNFYSTSCMICLNSVQNFSE